MLNFIPEFSPYAEFSMKTTGFYVRLRIISFNIQYQPNPET